MMNKKKNKLSINELFNNNRFLRILSVIVAFGIWLLISTTIDPNAPAVVKNVPVTVDLTNTAPGNNGLSIANPTVQYVDIYLVGKSYEIGSLEPEDFIVTLDNLDQVTQPGTYTLPLRASLKPDSTIQIEINNKKLGNLTVEFDRQVEKTIQLEAYAPNKETAESFMIDECTVSPNEITVTGPEHIVSQIDSAVVENTEKMKINSSTSIDGTLYFKDANGNNIDASYLQYKDTQFKISIPLYKKVTLPLTFKYINVPKGINADLLEYEIDPVSELSVAIPVDAAAGIQEISLGEIDFRKIDINKSLSFDVNLLAGYINLDDINQVTVHFLTAEYDKVYLSSENILAENIPVGYQVEIISTKVSDIRIIGKKEIVDSLTSEDVIVTADFSNINNLTTGEQRVPVSISLTDGKQAWAIGEKSILVSVTQE